MTRQNAMSCDADRAFIRVIQTVFESACRKKGKRGRELFGTRPDVRSLADWLDVQLPEVASPSSTTLPLSLVRHISPHDSRTHDVGTESSSAGAAAMCVPSDTFELSQY